MTEKSAIINCNFGFGVGVREGPNGRAEIYVVEDLISPDYDGPALRAFMERTAVCWLEQVAPYLLARDEVVPRQ